MIAEPHGRVWEHQGYQPDLPTRSIPYGGLIEVLLYLSRVGACWPSVSTRRQNCRVLVRALARCRQKGAGGGPDAPRSSLEIRKLTNLVQLQPSAQGLPRGPRNTLLRKYGEGVAGTRKRWVSEENRENIDPEATSTAMWAWNPELMEGGIGKGESVNLTDYRTFSWTIWKHPVFGEYAIGGE